MIIIISPVVIAIIGVVAALTMLPTLTAGALIAMLAIVVAGLVVAALGLGWLYHRHTSPVRAAQTAAQPALAHGQGFESIPQADRAQAVIAAARAMGIELDTWQAQVLAAAYAVEGPLYVPTSPRAELRTGGNEHG